MPAAKGYKPSQHIPELFKEIIRHDAVRPTMSEPSLAPAVTYIAEWIKYRALMEPWLKRPQELTSAAERALAWNHNKGNTA